MVIGSVLDRKRLKHSHKPKYYTAYKFLNRLSSQVCNHIVHYCKGHTAVIQRILSHSPISFNSFFKKITSLVPTFEFHITRGCISKMRIKIKFATQLHIIAQ
jgi:hypothetical protein